MNVKYDAESDAAYIRLSSHPIARTEEESDVCMLDLDPQGNVVAIELLSVFGFAGASLHLLTRNGRISADTAESILSELRHERVPA